MLRTTRVAIALVCATGASSLANPASSVPSALSPGIGESIHLDIDYEYDLDDARITREQVGDPQADPLAPLPVHRELDYHHTRHLLTPRLELGVYHDVWLSIAVPIVLSDTRELDVPAGIDRTTLSTFRDGILTNTGFDAGDPTTPPSGAIAFRGVTRSGIGELRGGIGVAPMNQARDATKPTWKLGVELRAAIGRVMRFDAVNPGQETGVSTGVHELRLWTSMDRRFRYFEGWFEAYYQRPIYTRATSLFQDPGFGSANIDPAQTAGASFGLEAYVASDPATGNEVSVDLGARLDAHFEGRGYSEMWEVFALAGDHRIAGPLALDADPTTPGQQELSHPGISNLENYLETAARIAVRGTLGAHVSFAALGELIWKTDHVISFADAGIDLPTCPTGTPRCETADNDQVNPGTAEVNPLHQPRIDLVGHRYHSEHNRGYVLGVQAALRF
ncbi:MAG TPA: hypothetical protein VFT22_19305 [Kofleriaceae bacterium]|nr:hypothetical protein [Kofleriaceae bacterium]